MKKIVVLSLLIVFIASIAFAETRKEFYSAYNPTATGSFVYSSAGAVGTGDTVDVFTYDKKTIFINCETLASTGFSYQVEGRSVGEAISWSVLDSGGIGAASTDAQKNIAIEVTELVDYLRIGIGRVIGNSTDKITIRGLFRKSN